MNEQEEINNKRGARDNDDDNTDGNDNNDRDDGDDDKVEWLKDKNNDKGRRRVQLQER